MILHGTLHDEREELVFSGRFDLKVESRGRRRGWRGAILSADDGYRVWSLTTGGPYQFRPDGDEQSYDLLIQNMQIPSGANTVLGSGPPPEALN